MLGNETGNGNLGLSWGLLVCCSGDLALSDSMGLLSLLRVTSVLH